LGVPDKYPETIEKSPYAQALAGFFLAEKPGALAHAKRTRHRPI